MTSVKPVPHLNKKPGAWLLASAKALRSWYGGSGVGSVTLRITVIDTLLSINAIGYGVVYPLLGHGRQRIHSQPLRNTSREVRFTFMSTKQ